MKEVMILAFDVGNTNISFCKFKKDNLEPIDFRRISYRKYKNDMFKNILYDKIKEYISDAYIEGIIYSSVNKDIDSYIEKLADDLNFKKIVVSPSLNLPIEILYDDPFALGADRICNAVAVNTLYPNDDIIIVDMGTAITVCVMLKGKIFKGGLILPGADISLDVLFEKTSLLKRVDFKQPDKLIATNSEDAIRSGIYYGLTGMLKSIISRIEDQEKLKFKKIITGGFAENLMPALPDDFLFDKYLIMKGLKIIFDLNC